MCLNRQWVEADLRITTGFVEPHFFAGFSGGPKLVAPGLAGLETVLTLHDATPDRRPARHLGRHPRATRSTTTSAPSRRPRGVDFALDVVLNREQRIVEAFGGDLLADARRRAARPRSGWRCSRCPAPFDVVVTTNAGYPARPEPLPGGEGHVGRRRRW